MAEVMKETDERPESEVEDIVIVEEKPLEDDDDSGDDRVAKQEDDDGNDPEREATSSSKDEGSLGPVLRTLPFPLLRPPLLRKFLITLVGKIEFFV